MWDNQMKARLLPHVFTFLLSLTAVMVYEHYIKQQPDIITVDVAGITQDFSEFMTKQAYAEPRMDALIKDFSQALENSLDHLAERGTVLIEGAVLAGGIDATETVKSDIMSAIGDKL